MTATAVRPVAASHVIDPRWKSLRLPPGTAYSSDTGYPSAPASQPRCAHASKPAPCTTFAPMPGVKYACPPVKCCSRPPSTSRAISSLVG